jgi:hypothetical protein
MSIKMRYRTERDGPRQLAGCAWRANEVNCKVSDTRLAGRLSSKKEQLVVLLYILGLCFGPCDVSRTLRTEAVKTQPASLCGLVKPRLVDCDVRRGSWRPLRYSISLLAFVPPTPTLTMCRLSQRMQEELPAVVQLSVRLSPCLLPESLTVPPLGRSRLENGCDISLAGRQRVNETCSLRTESVAQRKGLPLEGGSAGAARGCNGQCN